MRKIWSLILKPQTWIAKILILLAVSSFFSLEFSSHLKEVTDILNSDELSLTLGETKVSAYLLIKAAITIFILFWVTSILSNFGEKRINTLQNIRTSNRALLNKGFQLLIYALAFIIGMDFIGIDLTALAIFSGAVGIGLGFGLQKITSNFISGLILLFEKSVEKDDLVELAGGITGFARHIGARFTLVETFEGKEIMVPNEDFITSRVTNWTFSNTKGRLEINIAISYDSDIDTAMRLMLEAAKEHPRTLDTPEPNCFLREFANSSINFTLFFWIADISEGRHEPRSDIQRKIWKKFNENGILMPYPQRDIHIKSGSIANG